MKMKPWTKLSEVPLNHWFIGLTPNGELTSYLYRIGGICKPVWPGKQSNFTEEEFYKNADTIQVEIGGVWWDISALLNNFKHLDDIDDVPDDCGTNVE